MRTKDMTLTALLLAVLIVCSQIALPLGPVPVTFQTFAVVLIGLLVKPKQAFFTTFLYLVTGLIGLPVFAGGGGGFQAFLSPSFGFVVGFIPAAFFQAFYLSKQREVTIKELSIAAAINFFLAYAFGLLYMAFILRVYWGNILSFYQILMTGFIPFLPGDLLKNTLAVTMAKKLRPQLRLSAN